MKLSESQRWLLSSLEEHRGEYEIVHESESSKQTLRARGLVARRKRSGSCPSWEWAITNAGVAALRAAGVPAPEAAKPAPKKPPMDEYAMLRNVTARAVWYFTRVGWNVAAAALEAPRFDWSLLLHDYEWLRDGMRSQKRFREVVTALVAFHASQKAPIGEYQSHSLHAKRVEEKVVPAYEAALASFPRLSDAPWKIDDDEKRATIRGIEARARLITRGRWSVTLYDRGINVGKTAYCERVAQVDATARAAVDAYLLSEAQKP